MNVIRNHKQRVFSFLLSLAILLGMAPFAPMEAMAADENKVILSTHSTTVFENELFSLSVRLELVDDIKEEDIKSITWSIKSGGGTGAIELPSTMGEKDITCQIKGVREGTVTVRVEVSVEGYENFFDECEVTVNRKKAIESITLNSTTRDMEVSDTFELIATVIPKESTDQIINWSSSNTAIVDILHETTQNTHKNTLTAKQVGEVTVTAYAADTPGILATCIVRVTAPPEEIRLGSSYTTVVVDKTITISSQVIPTYANKKTVVWKAEWENPLAAEAKYGKVDRYVVVDYKSGKITGKAVSPTDQKIFIVATVEGTKVTEKCEIEVTISAVPVQSIEFLQKEITVVIRKTAPVLVKVTPSNASNKKLRLESENPSIATVPATGTAGTNFNVTGISLGTTKIKAICEETGDEIECTIKVIPVPADPVTKVALNPTQAVMVVGGTVTPKATLTPSTATIKTLKWTTSDNNIAGVETNGKVNAKTGGVAIITAIPDGAVDSEGKQLEGVFAECKVHVLALDKTEASLGSGGSTTLTLNNLPQNQGYVVNWTTTKTATASVSNKTSNYAADDPTPSTTITGGAAGEATITATVKSGATTVATLKCLVTVGAAKADTIYYYIDGKANVPFVLNDFNNVCLKMKGNALDFIKFTELPPSNEGTLYNLYDKTGEAKVDTATYYYRSGAPTIANTSFVPASTFVGPARIYYEATDAKGNKYPGTIEIAVSDAAGDIQYSTAMNEPVTFNGKDFNEYCKKTSENRQLNSIKFTLPNAREGALYYMYNVDSAGKVTGKKITATENYYYTNAPGLDDITFVPAKDFLGTVDIKFTGRDTSTNLISGTVRVIVGRSASGSADIQYVVKKNEVCHLDVDDFNNFCIKKFDSNLNYVRFLLPGEYKGELYYNYTNERNYDSLVTETRSYYRSSNPYLDEVAFVPAKDYEGRVSVRFTARTMDGNDVSGTMAIFVGDGIGDIRYSAGTNVPIEFEANDFNDFCKGETGANLDYVQFNLPKNTEGEMYHRFGRSAETKVTANTMYLRAGTPMLDEITFIPAMDFTGMIEFDFTGRTTDNKTITGTVVLVYDDEITGGTALVRYATEYRPVEFESGDFERVCENRGETSLRSVQFTLPPATVGHLYEGYRGPNDFDALVDPETFYPTGSGAGSLGDISFVPRAGVTGSIAIPYKATDEKGGTYNAYVQVIVSPMGTSRFVDMYTDVWAIASVEFLYEYDVIRGTGTNTYGPQEHIIRGDFMLMLYRAFELENADYNNFRDVPAGSYYADAIAAARAVGIAQGDDNGLFHPASPITREDAMVLIHRTLEQTGRGVEDASSAYLSNFGDGGRVSSYARSSVAALIQAGIIQGDENHNLAPLDSVTRAEMAMIMHRVLTM